MSEDSIRKYNLAYREARRVFDQRDKKHEERRRREMSGRRQLQQQIKAELRKPLVP